MDWREELPEHLRSSLESLLDSVNSHGDVYSEAENSSVGQIWVALALLNRRTEKLESIVKAQRKALKSLDADFDVDQHLDEELKESLSRY